MAESNQGKSQNANAQQKLTQKHLLQKDALYQYILQTNVYPREPECLKELRELTANHSRGLMAIPPDEGQFLILLLKLINAKKTIEIGVFTGYSLLCTALALPPDGKVIGIDMNRESYNLGRPIIEKAGVAHKIDFREGLALPILDELIQNEEMQDSFDFAFIDADKVNALNYHERLLNLVKIGGLICYDNTLWSGSVAEAPDAAMSELGRNIRHYTIELNKALAADRRIEISLLPIGDGLTLCRRIS
uniref:Caffeoyl-CoA O-methyltransferase n=1 Tax=Cunninghamia lanceolata TaxID=28977 RepID=K7YN79_CUNLA|nr:caffeoyl-CoA O-methyltransferase [Cunninghamia lanceolata]